MNSLSLRQLAIRLACSHPDDRAWIRAQLEPLACPQIDALLMEIADLGLDKDPAVLMSMLIVPGQTATSTSLQHPYWRALSGQTTAPALVRHLACAGD